MRPQEGNPKLNQSKGLRLETASAAHHLPTDNRQTPELRSVVDAWPGLSAPIRAAILALVSTASGDGGGK
jgi:hypothetical protein